MTPCESFLADLVDDLAGELSAERHAALAAHLGACAGCRAEKAALSDTDSLLRETARPPEPLEIAGFVHRASDRAERFRDRSLRGLFWSFTRPQRFVAAFSTTALALSVVLFVGARTAPEPVNVHVTVPVSTALVADGESGTFDEAAGPSLDDAFEELTMDELDALTELLTG